MKGHTMRSLIVVAAIFLAGCAQPDFIVHTPGRLLYARELRWDDAAKIGRATDVVTGREMTYQHGDEIDRVDPTIFDKLVVQQKTEDSQMAAIGAGDPNTNAGEPAAAPAPHWHKATLTDQMRTQVLADFKPVVLGLFPDPDARLHGDPTIGASQCDDGSGPQIFVTGQVDAKNALGGYMRVLYVYVQPASQGSKGMAFIPDTAPPSFSIRMLDGLSAAVGR
jgi:hypothetical protein